MATDEEFPSLEAAAATSGSKTKKDKGQKVSLGEFLGSGGGSWADEVIESLPTAPAAARGDDYSTSYAIDSRGNYSDRDSYREPRDYPRQRALLAPLPTSPPFTAYVGNLPYDITDQEVGSLFRGVTHVRLVRDRDGKPKGFAYVEFQSVEALKGGLVVDGMSCGGRSLRVNVAEPPRDRHEREDRTDVASWRRTSPVDPSRRPHGGNRGSFSSDREVLGGGFGSGFGGSFGGGFGAFGDWAGFRDRRGSSHSFGDRHGGEFAVERDWRRGSDDDFRTRRGFGDRPPREPSRADVAETWMSQWQPSSPHALDRPPANDYRMRRGHGREPSHSPRERHKLILQPRGSSGSLSSEGSAAVATAKSSKPNPFGEAKPRDENKALQEVEERRRRREEEQRRRAAEAKQAVSAGAAKD